MLGKLFKSLFAGQPARAATSISDNEPYTAVCKRAASDAEFFAIFRRDPAYTRILEHVSEPQGQAYLQLISRDEQIVSAIEVFKRNDLFGGPRLCDFPQIGMVSPSTLRYVKVLADLKAHFGALDGMTICEIGIGYGGQCRVINAYYRPAAYCLIDLRPALDLARRFLGNFETRAPLSFRTMDKLDGAACDLAISNYAFTELARPVQDEYLSRVILKARRGYMTYNEISPPAFNSYKADELVAMIPGARKIAEEPLTHPRNCIIVWGGQ